VFLDSKSLATPAKAPLLLPSRGLAEAIAAEWAAQGERLQPASLPLTQLANTAVDRVASNPASVLLDLLAYAAADLLCYRAEQPESLVERQQSRWQPLLDWLALRHDAPLLVHAGIIANPQPEASLAALRRHLSGLSPFALAGLGAATQTAGSLVIALALHEGKIGADEAFELSELDATFQIERWGEDPEATARRQRLRQDLREIQRFMQLLAA
jgi:chaperone required for assembly of F1-ATPase